MASTVRLKRSAVQGKAPVVGDLELGELAVNTYDGKLYMKKNDGGDSIVEITAAGGYTDPLTTNGDILIRSGGATTRLGIGSEGQALLVSSGLPVWGNVAGGYTDPLTTDGDIVIRSGGSTVRLGIGSEGQVLKVSSGLPVWAAESGGYTDPLTTDGDIVIRSGGSTTRLGIGSEGQVLKVSSGLPVWAADAGGLADVVDDTTPQLGGNLDVNGNYIISASGGDVEIAPDTTGSFVIRGNNTDGSITLNCTANTHGVTIQSPPHASAATYTLILPDDTGTSGQVLSTNGTGTLSSLTATQPGDNISTLTNDSNFIDSAGAPVQSVNTQTGAVVLDADDIDDTSTAHKFATATQLANADSATQPGDNISTLTNDSGYITTGSTTSDAAPSTPSDGDLWYRSSDGRMYVYYDDDNTSQWVDANPNLPPDPDTFDRSGTDVTLVNSGDNVGLGTSSPTQKLDLESASGARIAFTDTGTRRWSIGTPAGGSTGFSIHDESGASEVVRITAGGKFAIGTTTPAVELDVNGEIRASTGVLFGTDTAAANTLDDYEEGTFTPTIFGVTTAGTYTISTSEGTYTKVGNKVTALGTLTTITEVSAGSGAVQIGNLPFTSKAASNTYAVGAVELQNFDVDNATVSLSLLLLNNESKLYIRETRDAAAVANVNCADITSGSSNIRFTITYLVD